MSIITTSKALAQHLFGCLKQLENFELLATVGSSFQAGVYFKIHLQMLKTLAFHYLLSVIVAKVFKLNRQDTICRAMLTIKLTGGNGAQGNSRPVKRLVSHLPRTHHETQQFLLEPLQ